MKTLKERLITETEFCKPDDICYVIIDKEGKICCSYLPWTGFGEGDKLKETALKMAKHLGEGHEVKEIKFKDLNQK